MTPPRDDEVEISVFGPGYGESILVHVGSRRWIVIDSCLGDDRRTPAPLKYMSDLGLDVSTDVRAVVATHWTRSGMSRPILTILSRYSAQAPKPR